MGAPTSLTGPDVAAGVPDADVREGIPLLAQVDGEAVLLVRDAGRLHAIGATCTHHGAPLAEGAVSGREPCSSVWLPLHCGRGSPEETRMSLLVQLELEVRDGAEAEFLRVARALAAVAATEAGTLRYQWYVTQKPGHYAILEEYVDADAAEAHNANVAPLLRELFAVVDLVSAAFYGELNPYLREWITGRDGITVNTPL